MQLASLEFEGFALVWWNQIQVDRERLRRHRVDTWMAMKIIMRERFVPPHYVREMHNKLQRLYQGSVSVDDYYKEMEISLIRENIKETNEATMARFFNGLNRDIQDVVELQSYNNMDELIHRVMKVEQQLNRKQTYKKTSYTYSSWIKTLPRRRILHNVLKGSLQEVILLLLLNPLSIKLVSLNALSVWERVILHPNVLTKGP